MHVSLCYTLKIKKGKNKGIRKKWREKQKKDKSTK